MFSTMQSSERLHDISLALDGPRSNRGDDHLILGQGWPDVLREKPVPTSRRIGAQTEQGNITCERASQGINAETGYGDISLAVVGASAVTVKTGGGRIDAVCVRGRLLASASSGEIFVRAVPRDDG
ncbi:MAG TPA: hypothetical protein VMG82_09690 [Candidatus Sulfotelmatobacter sp.]|nr:hypothetical protein [Candidatus Sulfotelmatobacter sp.]